MNRFQFVADHRHAFEVKRLCEVLDVARSSFYAWLSAEPARAARTAADAALAARIRTIHATDRALGAPRITAELNDGVGPDQRVNHKRVARVMRAHAIAGLRLRRRVRTTIPEPAEQKVPDLLRRDFTADAPNRRYVGDITYLPIADGSNLYLATVIDCFSRRLAGWAIAEHMRTDLIGDALSAAEAMRGTLLGAIFHSDYAEVRVRTRREIVSTLACLISSVVLWQRSWGSRRRSRRRWPRWLRCWTSERADCCWGRVPASWGAAGSS